MRFSIRSFLAASTNSDFWSRPFEFSFKDALAIAFSAVFLYLCLRAVSIESALAVVQTLIPLIGIILGGYFAQESVAAWFEKSQRNNK